MNLLLEKIQEYAHSMPEKTAIQSNSKAISYSQLVTEIQAFIPQLNANRIGLMMNNHPAWAIIDLATMFSRKCLIPIPTFFSNQQIKHTIRDAKLDLLIIEDKQSITLLGLSSCQVTHINILDKAIYMVVLDNSSEHHFAGKITYTSGTTGAPKGVMLSDKVIIQKTLDLAKAIDADKHDIGLSILPLSTLLENIGGLYVPLLAGATATILPPEVIGIQGSNEVNQQALIKAILEVQPSAFIVIPQLLLFLVKVSQSGIQLPLDIRFIAVGGAHVSKQLLARAKQQNLPVFQGYGLSEAGSVVSLNTEQENKLGSVGKPLSNHEIKIAEDGEILIKQQLFQGYLGQTEHPEQDFYASGDLGHIDSDGFLHILGRKKNTIVNSYGRNISPEWIESELESLAPIAQAVILGDARPFLITIIVASSKTVTSHEINQAIQKLNQTLPDYAQVNHFILAEQPFTLNNKQLNGAGHPIREKIYQDYFSAINLIYEKSA